MDLTRVIVDELTGGVAKSHRLATLVEVLEDGEPIEELWTVTDGTVTLDNTAASRGRADVTVLDEGDLELIPVDTTDLLAPHGHEIRISRGIRFDDREELVRCGVYRVDTVDSSVDGRQRVSGLDRSARVIDAKFRTPFQLASGADARTAIIEGVQDVWPDVPIATDFAVFTVALPALIASEGEDRWAFYQGIATACGAELYFNRAGELDCQPVPNAVGGAPVATYAEGEASTLLDANRSWTRLGAVNIVITTGESTDTAVAPPRGEAVDDNPLSPTYVDGPFGQVPYWESSISEYIKTQAQADTAAAAILSKKLGTIQSLGFSAIVDPARDPSEIVRVECPRVGVESSDHVLTQVTIPLSAEGVMSCRTRETQVIS